MKLAYVLWRDAMSIGGDGWTTIDDVDGCEGRDSLIEDVGWIYKEDKDRVFLIGGKSIPGDKSMLQEIVHRIVIIPKGCIIKMKTIKI